MVVMTIQTQALQYLTTNRIQFPSPLDASLTGSYILFVACLAAVPTTIQQPSTLMVQNNYVPHLSPHQRQRINDSPAPAACFRSSTFIPLRCSAYNLHSSTGLFNGPQLGLIPPHCDSRMDTARDMSGLASLVQDILVSREIFVFQR